VQVQPTKGNQIMKRLIAAVSFAVLATPVLADVGKPFEQLDLDRALPNIAERTVVGIEYPFGGSAPYEQLTVDRALPDIRVERSHLASSGATRSDVEIATEAKDVSPWANDHNFIAPAL
jgi:hypothetical protein